MKEFKVVREAILESGESQLSYNAVAALDAWYKEYLFKREIGEESVVKAATKPTLSLGKQRASVEKINTRLASQKLQTLLEVEQISRQDFEKKHNLPPGLVYRMFKIATKKRKTMTTKYGAL